MISEFCPHGIDISLRMETSKRDDVYVMRVITNFCRRCAEENALGLLRGATRIPVSRNF